MTDLEFKEFRPFSYSRWVFDGERAPAWVKKLSHRKKGILHELFARALAEAMDSYLETIVGNLPIKRKLEGKITEHDLKALVAEIRRKLRWLQKYSYGAKPMPFTRKNPYYRNGDEKAPFYSEAFLYPLLGKEEGRTVCYSFEQLCRMVGLET